MNKTEESIDMGMGVLDQDMTPEEIAELEMEAQLAAEQLLAEVQQAEHQVELNPSVEMLSEMSHSYMLSPTLASLLKNTVRRSTQCAKIVRWQCGITQTTKRSAIAE